MAELLVVPFKKSSDVDIVKPLKNLIQSTYNTGESSDDYSDPLNELSRLRANAVWKVFEKSSLELIYSYYDQLVSLESKIPPQEVQIPFKWKDAFDRGSIFGGRMSLTISSLAYERMCILFNIGAMQSAVAAQQPLDTEDSLKLAAKLFQQAAGVFAYLKANIMVAVHQETTPDLNPETLDVLSKLMLAQAQEVIAYKCIRDEMKESMVAKVCAQCEELYTDVLRAAQKESLKPLWDREWIPTLSAKQMAFRGLAQFYQSLVCRANKAVGEEISRLQVAVESLRGAASRLPPGSSSRLQEHGTRAARHLADATRDNDFIYHERVPEPAQLEPISRAPIAKPLPLPDRWTAPGKDLFGALMPAAVHAALQASSARRTELVNAEINKLRDATQLLNSVLASLSLPACLETAGDSALPASIREKAKAVREAGGVSELRRLMAELPELLQRNKDILDEAERMLREEAEADASLRSQFGARWSRTESAKLTEAFRANADKYRQIIDNAVRADNIVQQKYSQHKESIELLSGSENDITVPDAPDSGTSDMDAVSTLRRLMDDVETMKAERDSIEASLKDTTLDLKEKFLSALAASGAVDEPALSAGELGAALAPLQRQVADSLRRQEQMVSEVQTAHGRLVSSRGGSSGRDQALARLCAAYDAFQELTGNLNEGVKFYNDLTQLLVAFQNKVSDFCFARKTEKEELLKDLTLESTRDPARPAPAPPQHHVDGVEPPVVKKDAPPRPPPPSTAPSAGPSAQPSSLPYPTQPQGMPLPYAATGAPYPYYAAPMPAMYNPYATLPYPHHARMPPPQTYQPYQYPQPPAGYPQPPPAGYNPYQQQ